MAITEFHGIALPSADTKRWVKSRKLAVVEAIERDLLTEDEALKRYGISAEELESWGRLVRSFGPDALRATHINRYRSDGSRASGSGQ